MKKKTRITPKLIKPFHAGNYSLSAHPEPPSGFLMFPGGIERNQWQEMD